MGLSPPWIYPFLFAFYPILHLYAENADRLSPAAVIAPAAISLSTVLILLLGTNAVLKDVHKSACLVSLFVVLFFSVNHLLSLINEARFVNFHFSQGRYQILLFLVLFTACAVPVLRATRNLQGLSRTMTVIGTLLVVFNVARVAVAAVPDRATWTPAAPQESKPAVSATTVGERPDIYYIILDGYASSISLRRLFGYDNHEFENFLKSRGFFIASESRSNYQNTMLSLASTFNMNYLRPSKEAFQETAGNNLVWQLLKEYGYRIIPLESWSRREKGLANRDYLGSDAWVGLSEFSLTLLRTSAADPILARLHVYDSAVRQTVLKQLDKFEDVADEKGPKLVYAHIMSPHPPYVFGPDGEAAGDFTLDSLNIFRSPWDYGDGYLNQVKFINKRMIRVVESLLNKYSNTPFVMIIQADHGPKFVRREDERPEEYYETRFNIMNTYLLPGGGSRLLYENISPVNTFRVIFNRYFQKDYPILQDKHYFSSNDAMPFNLREVTDKFRRSVPWRRGALSSHPG